MQEKKRIKYQGYKQVYLNIKFIFRIHIEFKKY